MNTRIKMHFVNYFLLILYYYIVSYSIYILFFIFTNNAIYYIRYYIRNLKFNVNKINELI